MTDRPADPSTETPIQRALRLKKASLQNRQEPPRGVHKREASASLPGGGSKPWMKK
jgi:hypothetical protein